MQLLIEESREKETEKDKLVETVKEEELGNRRLEAQLKENDKEIQRIKGELRSNAAEKKRVEGKLREKELQNRMIKDELEVRLKQIRRLQAEVKQKEELKELKEETAKRLADVLKGEDREQGQQQGRQGQQTRFSWLTIFKLIWYAAWEAVKGIFDKCTLICLKYIYQIFPSVFQLVLCYCYLFSSQTLIRALNGRAHVT